MKTSNRGLVVGNGAVRRRVNAGAISAVLGLFFGGCVVAERPHRHEHVIGRVAPPPTVIVAEPARAEIVVVQLPPPPPRVEVIVARPSPRHVWIGGYWAWRGGRHVWVNGHWELPPHGRAVWVAPRWEPRGGGHIFIEGFWR